MNIMPEILDELRNRYELMEQGGKFLAKAKLANTIEVFRERFGPEALIKLNDTELLYRMHHLSDKESLVYWLEFKNDDEFPGRYFGSIGGGSALKYGVYWSNDKQSWITGTPQKMEEISESTAIGIARKHRDELVKGCEILKALTPNAGDDDYFELQNEMTKELKTVSDSAWGHKYFSILFSDKLDDFHNPDHQRFHLIKIRDMPPETNGRYVCAGRFITIAKELNIPVNDLTAILFNRNGPPHRYWRIGTSDGTEPRNRWESMKQGNYVAIGWESLGNLSELTHDQMSLDKLKIIIKDKYPTTTTQLVGKESRQVLNFVTVISPGDIVVAADGQTALGIGRIKGEYQYSLDSVDDHSKGINNFPNRRNVEWLSLEEWRMDILEGPHMAVKELTKPINLLNVENVIAKKPIITPKPKLRELTGVLAQIQKVLERKGQVILYGPPGTGKTYWAEITARELAARNNYGLDYDSLSEENRNKILGSPKVFDGYVRLCCFHPSYGYEDFLEGYRPESVNGQMSFILKDGLFKKLCDDAKLEPQKQFYIIIDEINRGDIPRIFGELLTIMEKSKRGKTIILPLSGESFSVPSNVSIIGTMNTADRSIALLDTALRRRFGFLELMPDTSLLKESVIESIPLGKWLENLNRRICNYVGKDARNLQIGHSYFLDEGKPINDFSQLLRVIQEDIIPLIEEYCYEDYEALAMILGDELVDKKNYIIRHDLLNNDKPDVIRALLIKDPELITENSVIKNEQVEEDDDEDDVDNVSGEISQ